MKLPARLPAALLAVAVMALGSCGGVHRPHLDRGLGRVSGADASVASADPRNGGPATNVRARATATGPSHDAADLGAAPALTTAAPGTYRYRQSGHAGDGRALPPEGFLMVDAANADGMQMWHRVADASQPSSDTMIAVRPDGVFVSYLVLRYVLDGHLLQITCFFDPPPPAVPWPPRVGATADAEGECGTTTAAVSTRVDDIRSVTVANAVVHAVVVTTTFATHGTIEASGTEVQWFSPELGIPVRAETHEADGTGAFRLDLTGELESAHPS